MADDDFGFFVVAIPAVVAWGAWYRRVLISNPIHRSRLRRLSLCVGPLLSFGLVEFALRSIADDEVRGSLPLQLFFLGVAALSLRGMMLVLALLGLDALEDGLERKNSAAILSIYGLWAASTCCVIGANTGAGDTIGTTLGPLAMSLVALVSLIAIFAAFTRGFSAIAVERDLAAGFRFAGLTIAWGLILGRAVAGDWISVEATWSDFFREGWPVIAILALALFVERLSSPRTAPSAPFILLTGFLPALAYLGVSALVLQWIQRFAPL